MSHIEVLLVEVLLLSQELKQDISSFRYEVMGMMKTGKPALQGAKAGGSSADSSLAYSNPSLDGPPGPQGSQVKSKLNRFKIITSILKQGSSSPRPPEASNGLPNGVLSTVSDEDCSEKSSERRNFPKDINDFGLFPKCHWGGNDDTPSAGEISRQIYSLTEVDVEREDKEAKDEKGLLKTQTEEETAVKEALNEYNETLDADSSSEEGRKKETAEKDKENLPCSNQVADGCMTGSEEA